MQNLYDAGRAGLFTNKFEVNELLFVEYECPIPESTTDIWTPRDYLVHVISGRKSWRTPFTTWTAERGQTLYIKKGAFIIDQFFEDDFCVLLFFIPDDFIRNVIREIAPNLGPVTAESDGPAIHVDNDAVLMAYFQSVSSYFSQAAKPTEALVVLKLKELIINIVTGASNPRLAAYFRSLADTDRVSIEQVMEDNFAFNLSLADYARLCNRSLSTFKREFSRHFHTSPGRWLQARRLDHAAGLLKTSSDSVTGIVFECGFEDLSHFSRSFKARFGVSPAQYRSAKPV